MKKVININFQGSVTPIEESAYELLKQYIESLRNFFTNEESKEEIINDIEGRIAELFAEILKKGNSCIVDTDVEAIMKSMGRPEDFEAEEGNVKEQLHNNNGNNKQQQQQQYTTGTNTKQRFYRNENDKVLGGVCSAISDYVNVDPVIIRIIFVVLCSILFIPYLLLWALVPSRAQIEIGTVRKRLYRDPETATIGGVCAGLANYFDINVWIPRLLFLVPFLTFVFRWGNDFWGFPHFFNLSFSPGATLIYVVLWIILPEAKTTSEKLQMKGEKVDLNSIKNTIAEDVKVFANKLNENSKKSGSAFGRIIEVLVKGILYFITIFVVFILILTFGSLGIASLGLMPISGFILKGGLQTFLAWSTIILFIWVPVISLIVWGVRRITGNKGSSGILAYSFSALWFLGWVSLTFFLVEVGRDFKYRSNPVENTVQLTNPKVNKLEIKAIKGYSNYDNNDYFRIEPFDNIGDDTVYAPNIALRFEKATSDSFAITLSKKARGRSRTEATNTAANFTYEITQKDSVLNIDKGIAINEQYKFRNQRVLITVYVPVGKRIFVNENVQVWNNVNISWNNDNFEWQDYEGRYDQGNWRKGREYIMTQNGLKLVVGNTITEDEDAEIKNDINNIQDEIDRKKRELEELKKNIPQKPDTIIRYKYKSSSTVVTAPIGGSVTNTDDALSQTPAAFMLHKIS